MGPLSERRNQLAFTALVLKWKREERKNNFILSYMNGKKARVLAFQQPTSGLD